MQKHGLVLFYERINKFMKHKTNAPVFREFSVMLRQAGIAAWILRLAPIPEGILTAKILSDIVAAAIAGDSSKVLINSAVLLCIVILMKGFELAGGIWYGKASSDALHRCKLLLYKRFLSCPLTMLYQSEHGSAVEMLNDDFDTVTDRVLNLYPALCTGILTTVAYFAFLVLQNPGVALILLAISVLQILPPLVSKRFLQKNYDECRKIEAELTNCTFEYVRGFAEIKVYKLKRWCLDRLAALHKDYLKTGNRSEASGHAQWALQRLTGNILTYGTYGILGLFVLRGYAALDVCIEAIALSGGLYSAVQSIFDTIPHFGIAKTAEKRMEMLYHTEKTEAQRILLEKAPIVFHKVSLSFGGKEILRCMDLTVQTDGTVLIKGANGIGKSTCLKLAVGMLAPDAGNIEIGGISPVQLSEHCFPREVFYLPQEDAGYHFAGKELLEMFLNEDADKAFRLAERFDLDETLLAQPLDTLSGGERKKVFLSLAFALNPSLMLLDEPTNSLDEKGRKTLCALLLERSGGTVIVTHDTVFDTIAARIYTITEGGAVFGRNASNASASI